MSYASAALLVAFVFVLSVGACSKLQDAVDASQPIVDPLLRVIGYCRSEAPERVEDIYGAYARGDRVGAILAAASVLHDLRDRGVEVPAERYADLVEAVAAVEGLERGLRALDGRDEDGERVVPSLLDAGAL